MTQAKRPETGTACLEIGTMDFATYGRFGVFVGE